MKSRKKSTKNKSKNTKLYKKVISDAKKKFKVWPSAYASAWVIKGGEGLIQEKNRKSREFRDGWLKNG